MGKTYDFLSKWTGIDNLLAPYNAGIFEKVANSYGRGLMVSAVVGLIMLCAGLAGMGSLTIAGLQRAYLTARGIETRAVVLDVVLDASRRGRPPDMATVRYEFETRSGEKISDELRRPPWEVADVARGRPVELLYAEQWPQINLPRPGFRNSGYLTFMFFLCLALNVHLTLFLIRYWAWRRRKSAALRLAQATSA